MKMCVTRVRGSDSRTMRYAIVILALLGGVASLRSQPYYLNNLWTNPGSGKWEVASNWSAGTPPGIDDDDQIYVGVSVIIDATTSGSFSNTMTVSYLELGWPVVLDLNNAGTAVPLHILQDVDVSYASVPEIIVSNSAIQVDGVTTLGNLAGDAGNFELDSGWATFGNITLGNSGNGDLFINGGTLTVLGTMTFGMSPGSGGYVGMYGGTLIHTNNSIVLGNQGYAAINMYGGFVKALGFQIGNGAGSQGFLNVIGGTVSVSSNILVGNSIVTNPCSVTVSSGALFVTNIAGTAYVDVAHNGSLTLNGGLLELDDLILTNGGTFSNLSGTFQLGPAFQVDHGGSAVFTGGTNNFESGITLGSIYGGFGSMTLQSNCQVNVNSNLIVVSDSLFSTSTVTVVNSTLNVPYGTIAVGLEGKGLMSISGSTVLSQKIHLGGPGAFGKVVFNSGYVRTSELLCNWWVGGGGDLDGNGGTMILGDAGHDSLFQLDNGASTNWGSIYVGYGVDLTGTITNDGGVMSVTNDLLVGNCESNSTGIVVLSGTGSLYVTNTAHNAVLEVQQGSFIMSGGSLVVDILRVTNTCGGTFIRTGGTLQAGALDLAPDQSAVGDSIPNGWKQQYGFDPFDPTVASADPDHDGANNLEEYLAGTNPKSAASVFRMLSAAKTNVQDIVVMWTTVGQHSYVVQTNGDLSRRAFSDLSQIISIGGVGEGTASYLNIGGATNPSGFYRVRLGP